MLPHTVQILLLSLAWHSSIPCSSQGWWLHPGGGWVMATHLHLQVLWGFFLPANPQLLDLWYNCVFHACLILFLWQFHCLTSSHLVAVVRLSQKPDLPWWWGRSGVQVWTEVTKSEADTALWPTGKSTVIGQVWASLGKVQFYLDWGQGWKHPLGALLRELKGSSLHSWLPWTAENGNN